MPREKPGRRKTLREQKSKPSRTVEFRRGALTDAVVRERNARAGPVAVVVEPKRGTSVEELLDILNKMDGNVTGHTDRYVFFKAPPATLDTMDGHKSIFKVWLDKKIEGYGFPWVRHLGDSTRTIKIDAVWRSFGALGEGVHWAVLDSGIYAQHPDFGKDGAGVVDGGQVHDYTGEGKAPADFHGTHVAGILGQIAPKVVLESHKVLGRQGGSTSMIVGAMYSIRQRNEDSLARNDRLAVHGVNMSLGGYPDVESYAVGWSPESREAARLVNQGCLVVVAAGNEGYKQFATVEGENVNLFPTFVPASIGDPGVAEEVITVGSTHARHPWRYGVSYFSSKGPTGDGRRKPDLVAPGERIKSFDDQGRNDREATGTSMAAPHVSGVLALFLSQFEAFQGRAHDVKRLLLDTCSDLGRDSYYQGRGLVDAFRLFQAV